MIKKIIIKLLFNNPIKQKILFGVASGMYVKYNPNNRLQHLLGLYEREIYPYLKKGIKKSDILVDVGANDGYFVLSFLKTGKKVIACEPGNIVIDLLENCSINRFNVNEHFSLITKFIGANNTVNSVKINEVAQNESIFYLVDIDGGEFELLYSTDSDFEHSNKTWLIETHSIELENSCMSFLKKWDYKVVIIKNAWWRIFIPEYRQIKHNRWIYAYK